MSKANMSWHSASKVAKILKLDNDLGDTTCSPCSCDVLPFGCSRLGAGSVARFFLAALYRSAIHP